jgi:ABC-type Fe3+/spermidine/putrescine transport system ATPase subunit
VSGAVAIAARGLVVRHERGRFALAVPALELRRGEVLAVLGANGAGKSTLLQALAGLLPPRAGALERVGAGPALVFQRPLLLRGSARWNVEVALWSRGLPRRERHRRAEAALAGFGVAALAARDAATLSGGEARRVALARAFAVEPDALLLDEPFDDLDADARERLVVDLRRALADRRVAVALVSHELRHALALADRIALLHAGRLVQVGPRDAVLRRPADAAVAPLVGMTNLLPGRVAGRADGALVEIVLATGGRLLADTEEASVGAAVVAGVRPEHVKLDLEGGDRAFVGRGRVRELFSDGAVVTAWIEWQGALLRTHLLAGRGLGHELKPGAAVRLAIRPEDVHVMPPSAGADGAA